MELSDPHFMVLLPMLCTSCSRPLSNKQDAYEKLIKETTYEDTLDRLGVRTYCCRMHFLSPLTVPFGYPERPIGSIAQYEVHVDITQIWEGSNIMARQPVTNDSLLVLDQEINDDDDTKLLEAKTEMDVIFIPPSEFEEEPALEPIQSTTITQIPQLLSFETQTFPQVTSLSSAPFSELPSMPIPTSPQITSLPSSPRPSFGEIAPQIVPLPSTPISTFGELAPIQPQITSLPSAPIPTQTFGETVSLPQITSLPTAPIPTQTFREMASLSSGPISTFGGVASLPFTSIQPQFTSVSIASVPMQPQGTIMPQQVSSFPTASVPMQPQGTSMASIPSTVPLQSQTFGQQIPFSSFFS